MLLTTTAFGIQIEIVLIIMIVIILGLIVALVLVASMVILAVATLAISFVGAAEPSGVPVSTAWMEGLSDDLALSSRKWTRSRPMHEESHPNIKNSKDSWTPVLIRSAW